MPLGTPAEYSAVKNWHFTSTERLYVCVRKPTSCTVELYMTPVKTGKWLFSVFQFPCSIRTALFPFSLWRDHSVSFSLHLSFIRTLSCLISALLLSLLHTYISLSFPFSFVLFPSVCSLLHSVAFCLFLFSAPSLPLSLPLSLSLSWPARLHLLPLSSAALGLSLIIGHQNIFSSLLPCVPLISTM